MQQPPEGRPEKEITVLGTPQERAKDKRLRDIYTSSLEKFNALLVEQNCCCAICQRPFVVGAGSGEFKQEVYTPFQDHDHACCPRRLHKFCGLCNRGLLCYTCNKFVVGVIEKMKIPVDRLLAYLQKWSFIQPREHPKRIARAKRAKRAKRKKK
jgi:hypothetical protein